jgi:hypothetical protein
MYDTDCDDDNPEVNPDADERCNSIDDDCDGAIDEADAVDASMWFIDEDGDGFGADGTGSMACIAASGRVSSFSDCNDDDDGVHPGAPEHCDGVDEDCDGVLDNDAVDSLTWYRDEDEDGFGSDSATTIDCGPPSAAWAEEPGDCDDDDDDVNPEASEECNGIDDDCDGTLDDASDCPCTLQTRSGHSYLFCNERSDWHEAREACEDIDNFDLVTIDDSAEQDWVYDRAYEVDTWRWWWIGYNDRDLEDAFEWADGSSSSFTYWSSGQPDDAWGEDCVHMYDWSGRWNDLDCDTDRYGGTNLYYICESSPD